MNNSSEATSAEQDVLTAIDFDEINMIFQIISDTDVRDAAIKKFDEIVERLIIAVDNGFNNESVQIATELSSTLIALGKSHGLEVHVNDFIKSNDIIKNIRSTLHPSAQDLGLALL